jgi:hypothetical protein
MNSIELKAQLFDELVNNADNDDLLQFDKGTLVRHGSAFYHIDDESGEEPYDTIADALAGLGYEGLL